MATVLVVDDVAMFRNVVMHALKGAGHEALSAPDGEAALQMLNAARVDLVLLDLAMPKMNGLEFLQRLRADRRFDSLPVVVVSALTASPQGGSGLPAGAQAQLLKSRFSLRDLIRCVNDLLKVAA
jgi:CheY-like chemotaxis protein